MKIVIYTLFLSLTTYAFATETVMTGRYSVVIEDRLKNSENIIQIDQVSQFPFKEGNAFYVALKIRVSNKIPKVYIENQELPSRPQTKNNDKKNDLIEYDIKYKIKKAQEKIYIKLVNTQGKELLTNFILTVDDFDTYNAHTAKPDQKYSVGTSITNISYKETNKANYTSNVITGKISLIDRVFKNFLNIDFNLFGTLFVLNKNTPEAEMKFFGANARIGKELFFDSSEMSLIPYLGYYFTNGHSKDQTFGYKNLSGPQTYLSFQKKMLPQTYCYINTKLSLVSDTKNYRSDRYEFALGFGMRFDKKIPYSLNFDYSHLALPADNEYKISLDTISVGASITF